MHTDSAKILVATVGLALLGFHALAAPARLAPLSAYVGRIAEGETVFANRQFVFSAEASRALGDQPFIRFSNQDSIDLTVEASGELVVVTLFLSQQRSARRQNSNGVALSATMPSSHFSRLGGTLPTRPQSGIVK